MSVECPQLDCCLPDQFDHEIEPTPGVLLRTVASPFEGGTVTPSARYEVGDEATVQAVAADGWLFVNWTSAGTILSTDASFTFTINSDTELIATFELAP